MTLLALAGAMTLTSCGDRSAEEVEAARTSTLETHAPPERDDAERLEDQLMALGYLDGVEGSTDPGKRGVTIFDHGRAYPGYALVWAPRRCRVTLIDLEGAPVNTWTIDSCDVDRAVLLRDGDLLVVSHRAVRRLEWNGTERWQRQLRAHHDAQPTPDGGIVVLTDAIRRVPGTGVLPILDDRIVHLGPDGEIRSSLSLWDVTHRNSVGFELIWRPPSLSGRRNLSTAHRARVKARESEPRVDLFHVNKVEWMSRPELAERDSLYGLGNVLVTSRHQNAILMIDREREELVWAWGRGILSGPHDATVLANGNLLVFDNGLIRNASRVIEVDPRTERIVWEYKGEPGVPFYSLSRGTAQRLPNDNTLVVVSGEGVAREVTTEGEIVWEYWSPHFGKRGKRVTIAGMHRYGRDEIEALLPRD